MKILLLVVMLAFSPPAHAYVGPGAGFAFVTSFFLLLVTIFLAFFALLSWPFRFIWRFIWHKRPSKPARFKRVVVVGLDGLDPQITQELMDRGQLPNLKRLAEQGSFKPLKTTTPAISPVAWSTFATGVDPSRHGIFDFLTRDRKLYVARLSSAETLPPRRILKLGALNIPISKPRINALQRSQPFWQVLGRFGISSSVLRVPISYPPRAFKGTMLSAMCTPDLLGTQGSYTLFTTETDGGQDKNQKWISLKLSRGQVKTQIEGPQHPFCKDGRRLKTPLMITLDTESQGVLVKVGDRGFSLKLGQSSDWIEIAFRIAPGVRLRGICQFRLNSLEPLRLYMTPINIDPSHPAVSISHPFSFSVFLAKLIGHFATLGLAEDTTALDDGALDEAGFLEQVHAFQKERERMFGAMIRRIRRGACVCVFDGTDRVQHMFTRERSDPNHPQSETVDHIYKISDQMLERIFKLVDPKDSQNLLLVVSDHGFAPFSRVVHLNRWLMDEGYLALAPGNEEVGEYLAGVDWSKTRAFALGLSGIFLNIKGRESRGIVAKEEALPLCKEIAERLAGIVDSQNTAHPIRRVFITSELYTGPYTKDAPDLLVGYSRGYRASWETARGMSATAVVAENKRHWNGDHCIDPELVPGVVFCNHPIALDAPSIIDLAPTILEGFGVPAPPYMQGKTLFKARAGPG